MPEIRPDQRGCRERRTHGCGRTGRDELSQFARDLGLRETVDGSSDSACPGDWPKIGPAGRRWAGLGAAGLAWAVALDLVVNSVDDIDELAATIGRNATSKEFSAARMNADIHDVAVA